MSAVPESSVKHVEVMHSLVGTKEVGNNRGSKVDEINKEAGNPLGSPYCAATVSYSLNHAQAKLPEYRGGLAINFYNKSKDRYSAGDVYFKRVKVKCGDIVIWQKGSGINGHVGVVNKDWSGSTGETIEANTSSGDKGDQREGSGIFVRTRTIQPYAYFRIIGFARVKYAK